MIFFNAESTELTDDADNPTTPTSRHPPKGCAFGLLLAFQNSLNRLHQQPRLAQNMSRFFGRVLIPGSECSCTGHDGDNELMLSSAALPPEAVECRDPTTLLARSGKSAAWFAVCSLSAATPHFPIALRADCDGSLSLRSVGPSTIHVTGHTVASVLPALSSNGASVAASRQNTPAAASTAALSLVHSKKRQRPEMGASATPEEPATTTTATPELLQKEPPASSKESAKVSGKREEVKQSEEEQGEDTSSDVKSDKKLTKRQKKAKALEAAKAEMANSGGGSSGGGSGAIKLKSEQQLSGMGMAVKKPVLRHLGGGLKIKDTMLGSGAVPKPGAIVKILYEGWLADTNEMFDSRSNKRSPLSFRLGLREVVPGMDKGLLGMKVGGSREIHVPSSMGYGSKRTGPIPPDSDLVFKIELIGLG